MKTVKIQLPFTREKSSIQIPDYVEVTVFESPQIDAIKAINVDLKEELDKAILKDPDLLDPTKNKKSVAIAVPDNSRALPVATILPSLIDWLSLSIPELKLENIYIIVECGLHDLGQEEDIEQLVPENTPNGCKVIIHDGLNNELIFIGKTSKGTPFYLNKCFAKADYKIVVGQVDPHRIVGFTDGASGLVTGCSCEATLMHNHILSSSPCARIGIIEGNPVREDIDEAAQLAEIDLSIDFVLTPNKEIVQIYAGHHDETLKLGAETTAQIYGIKNNEKYDVVVAMLGENSDKTSTYDVQKSLHLASQAVREGGHIILLTNSQQNLGEDISFNYVSQFTHPNELISNFRTQESKLEAHKAYLLGRTLNKFEVKTHSELDQSALRKCYLWAANSYKVVTEWLEESPDRKKLCVITDANMRYFFKDENCTNSDP